MQKQLFKFLVNEVRSSEWAQQSRRVKNPETGNFIFYSTAVSQEKAVAQIKFNMKKKFHINLYGHDSGNTAVDYEFICFVNHEVKPVVSNKKEVWIEQTIFDFL